MSDEKRADLLTMPTSLPVTIGWDGTISLTAEVQETIRIANTEIDRLRDEVERLKQYERGELVPGSVVSEQLVAAGKWIEEEREACLRICDEESDAYDGNSASRAAARIRARDTVSKSPSEMHAELSWYGRKYDAK